MTGCVRWGRQGRVLALAGSLACCTGAFAEDPIHVPEFPLPESEEVLRMLERIEAEQRQLRQEIEALQAWREEASPPTPDAVESEGLADPTALFEAEEEPPAQGESSEITRILADLARLEAEQQAVRKKIESLGFRRDAPPALDSDSPVTGSEEAPGLPGDELMVEGESVQAEEKAEASAPALDEGEAGPLPEGEDAAGGEASTASGEEPAFSPTLSEQDLEEFRNLDFSDAAKIFREFLTRYPTHEDAGEAGPLPEGEGAAEGEASAASGEESVFSPTLSEPAATLYEQGREEFRNLNFYDAAKTFREFLTRYPTHEDAGEARYWLGEALYVEGRFQDAIAAFAEVIADEASPRRDAARLKTGYAWFELGDFGQARAILVEVRDRNPGSDLARLAQLRLDRLQRLAGDEP